MRLAVATAVAASALVAAGCGTVGLAEGSSSGNGKQLFVAKCGSCHVLADAGTSGTIGPNLDDAFAQARRDGLGEATIREVVHQQIAYPVQNPSTGAPGMPANLVRGEDAAAVAAYVASVAGVGGGATAPGSTSAGGATTGGGASAGGKADGKQVFAAAGCGSCHKLADAGASGTVGPNLDQTKPSKALVVDRVTHGKGAMPAFAGRLSDAEIQAVAEYVASVAGK